MRGRRAGLLGAGRYVRGSAAAGIVLPERYAGGAEPRGSVVTGRRGAWS